VDADTSLVISAYEKKIAKLEGDKQIMVEKLAQKATTLHSFDQMFELSLRFLSSPWNIWENGNIYQRKTVLRLLFKSPFTYTPENGIRTPQASVILGLFKDVGEKCKMVRAGGTT
jgi:hypothetical protein